MHFVAKFDVKNDMIIKTEESKKLGAKFLESADALTKVECLHLCCETENCDVFVYEEKVKYTLNWQLENVSVDSFIWHAVSCLFVNLLGSRGVFPLPLWACTKFPL